MVDFDADGNVITPTGILTEQLGQQQAQVDAQTAKVQAALVAPPEVPWEQDTNRADLPNVAKAPSAREYALALAAQPAYSETAAVTIQRASAYLDWLNQ